jgi:hypothetical protein
VCITARIALGLICILVVCGIFTAGLWPFHGPKNDVTWLPHGGGLRFGDFGSIFSSGSFKTSSSQNPPWSIEIWLQPGLIHDSNTFLAFSSPEKRIQFSLHQSDAILWVGVQGGIQTNRTKSSRLYVDNAFHEGKFVFITITGGPQGTMLYLDGALVKTEPGLQLSIADLTGQLVIGDSPVESASWSGKLRGLAIYASELTPAQVVGHYKSWTQNGRPGIAEDKRTVAVYLFDENRGRVIHNTISGGVNLYIPERYMILDEKFLEPPWKEFAWSWGYWKNFIINIVGFVPLGFVLCFYLSCVRQMKRSMAATIIFGALVSLTIEVVQGFLPTRQSGMTDLLTNTFGTALGAMYYQSSLMGRALRALANVLFQPEDLAISHQG